MIIAIRYVNAKLSEWWLLFLAESLREYCLWGGEVCRKHSQTQEWNILVGERSWLESHGQNTKYVEILWKEIFKKSNSALGVLTAEENELSFF